jgi:Pin2-interacting protein X1
MAASNSTALAEILGIPSSSSSSAHPSAVASPLPDPAFAFPTPATTSTTTTSNATATPDAKDLLQQLTTSSQSVGDYFKAKLNAKAHGERQARPTSAAAVSASTRDDDDHDGRAGLGLGFGGGPSRMPVPDSLDEEPVRGGIGASSLSMFATMFMPRQPTTNAQEENTATAGVEIVVSHDASDYDDNPKKSENMRAKEERRRKKEERRRKRAEEAGQVDRDRVAVDMPVDGARAARSKKKRREAEAPDGRLEDSHPSGADGREAIATKKRKKDKKSSKHRGLEE